MKKVIFGMLIFAMISIFLSGCGRRPDTDVTSSPEYNFSSFAGTVWKTKVKTALADVKLYTGRRVTYVLPPRSYDPAHPHYSPPPELEQINSVLPVGTRVRIEGLMKDNGTAGLLFVIGSLEDGKVVYLSDYLLAKNRFVFPGWSESKEWGVDPEILEKAE